MAATTSGGPVLVEGLHLPVLKAGSSLTPPSISSQMELTRTPMPCYISCMRKA